MKPIIFHIALPFAFILSSCTCPDIERLMHEYTGRVLVTPDGMIGSSELKNRGLLQDKRFHEYEKDARYNEPYTDAHVTPHGNIIIEILPSIFTSTTLGFNVTITILSPSDDLAIIYHESELINALQGETIRFDKINIRKERPTFNRSTYPFYVYKIIFEHGYYEKMKSIRINEGDMYLGAIPFIIDDEAYSYNYVASLYYETSPGKCSFNPAP